MQFSQMAFDDEEIVEDAELTGALTECQEAEKELAAAEGRRAKARHALVALLDDRGEKTLIGLDRDGQPVRATVVRGETTKVDEIGLRNHIGLRAYNKLTVRKLDTDKVTKAIEANQLPVAVYAEYVTISPRAAWPKITKLS